MGLAKKKGFYETQWNGGSGGSIFRTDVHALDDALK
jgi:hypothetical protein